MAMMPFHIPKIWLRGLFSLASLGRGFYALDRAAKQRPLLNTTPLDRSPVPQQQDANLKPGSEGPVGSTENCSPEFAARIQQNRRLAFLLGGMALLSWSLGGGRAAKRLLRPRAVARS